MPPPRVVEKEIGEKRVIGFSPVGISVCAELDVEAILADIPAGKQAALLWCLFLLSLWCFSAATRTLVGPCTALHAGAFVQASAAPLCATYLRHPRLMQLYCACPCCALSMHRMLRKAWSLLRHVCQRSEPLSSVVNS